MHARFGLALLKIQQSEFPSGHPLQCHRGVDPHPRPRSVRLPIKPRPPGDTPCSVCTPRRSDGLRSQAGPCLLDGTPRGVPAAAGLYERRSDKADPSRPESSGSLARKVHSSRALEYEGAMQPAPLHGCVNEGFEICGRCPRNGTALHAAQGKENISAYHRTIPLLINESHAPPTVSTD
jgi:hypothetical protein